ncbi:FAS-associated factor 1 [Trachymyrmex cornetzi]|uniref:FAS-associated factor 1 n=1 Tax=Trachymyrmex cornetzi TaxID=471704 RepID=A0A195DMP1_9HYME|nr:FAS-associated factor 1 [Trachymyrmex cornetzi]
MAENRDAILADFQACTGIDDFGEAILYLEQTNWDLLAAINKAMPQTTQQLPSEMAPDIEMVEEIKVTPLSSSSSSSSSSKLQTVQNSNKTGAMKADIVESAKPGTSRPKSCMKNRQLTFHINYLDNVYKINLSDLSTLRDLKQFIWCKTTVPPCQQKLYGWKKEFANMTPNTVLQTLDLPRENTLYLQSSLPQDGDLANEAVILSDRMTQTYTLNVKDEVHNKTYKLKFPGTRTVLEVKTDIYSLIDVPVRNQQWKGWPSSLKDDNVILAQSGICYPEHDLSVGKLPVKEEKKKVVDLIDSDSSIDEPEDVEEFDVPEEFTGDDDIFIDDVKPTKIERLMPENVVDEVMGTLHFAEQFEKRYGPAHPEFFTGTFEDALKESCLKPAKERKLLAVYLHHDNSVLANVFCTQLLGFETVLQLLSANFIVWGWDITYESNKERFLYSVTQTLGTVGSLAVSSIDVDTLPVLMIIMRSRSNTEIFTIVHGNVGVNELLTNLVQAVDVFQEQRRADIGVEEERQARERVKREQDRAYQESLAADRAKEEAKQMQEELEKKKKEQAENERLAEEARKEAHRQAVESSLPPEPQQGAGDGVMKVRVRLPAGKFLERKFQSDTPLQTLFNFLIVEGYPTEEYKLLSSWPRRDEKQSPKYEIFTQPRQFYQPRYVQRQELTDCFQCIKLLPSEMDPLYSHPNMSGHMFVILLLRQFRNFAPHVQEDNVLDSSKYPSLHLLYSFRAGYQIRLEHFAWLSTNRSEWPNPISNPSFYLRFISARWTCYLERFPNNDYNFSDAIVNMSYNSNILFQVVILAAIIPVQYPQFSMPLIVKFGNKKWSIFVIARNAVPLGPPTSPSKPGNNGITTNTLNTAPSLCALRILFNNVSPI